MPSPILVAPAVLVLSAGPNVAPATAAFAVTSRAPARQSPVIRAIAVPPTSAATQLLPTPRGLYMTAPRAV